MNQSERRGDKEQLCLSTLRSLSPRVADPWGPPTPLGDGGRGLTGGRAAARVAGSRRGLGPAPPTVRPAGAPPPSLREGGVRPPGHPSVSWSHGRTPPPRVPAPVGRPVRAAASPRGQVSVPEAAGPARRHPPGCGALGARARADGGGRDLAVGAAAAGAGAWCGTHLDQAGDGASPPGKAERDGLARLELPDAAPAR